MQIAVFNSNGHHNAGHKQQIGLTHVLSTHLICSQNAYKYSKVTLVLIFDPPGPGRRGGHYFHKWCQSQKNKNNTKSNQATTLHGALWVTLKYRYLY